MAEHIRQVLVSALSAEVVALGVSICAATRDSSRIVGQPEVGVFVLVPPNFDPSPDFRNARTTAATLSSALDAARPGKIVYHSKILWGHAQMKLSLGASRLVDAGLKDLAQLRVATLIGCPF